MEYNDHYLFDNNIPFKLNLICFSSIISQVKVNNDPIPILFKEFCEIEPLLDMNNLTKILYFNINTIHGILYEFDKIINIPDKMGNTLSFNYYLSLLISAEKEIINYEFSTIFILNFIII